MTTCQTLTLDFEDEMKNTRKLLERVNLDDAHRGFRPHAKSMPLDRLASHVAELPAWFKLALQSTLFRLELGFKPTVAQSTKELLDLFDKSVEEGRKSLAAATDEDMEKNWTFQYADQFEMTEVRTKVVRSFLNHLVHHRAQLGVYLRMQEIAIPGMYGPSADEM